MDLRRVLYVLFVLFVAGVSAMAGAVAGGMAVYSAVRQAEPISSTAAPESSLPQTTAAPQVLQLNATQIDTTITQVVEKAGPAVVTVVATLPGQPSWFGNTAPDRSSGSGVFISVDGYVLTNNHVVEGAQSVSLILADGKEIPAKVIGTERYADLAVLKAEGMAPGIAALGNSDLLKPGVTVVAIGSPLGDFKNTVTVGVVSATGRMLDTGRGYQIEDLIQTDAAINQGNSGGPLINLAGEVVGINTLIVRGSGYGDPVAEGLGFAIPVNTARAVSEQIIARGYFARPYLGIRWQPITPDIAAAYDLPVKWGIYVTNLGANSPAGEAGVRQGDILTRIGDIELDEKHSFINALFNYKPGDRIKIQVYRSGERLELDVILGEATS